jgi:hypothetical protein
MKLKKIIIFILMRRQMAQVGKYLSQYQIIGCKRPEIYEKGRLINIKGTNFNGIKGSEVLANYNGMYNATYGSNGLIIYLEYNKTNCDKLRDFILAQQKIS